MRLIWREGGGEGGDTRNLEEAISDFLIIRHIAYIFRHLNYYE